MDRTSLLCLAGTGYCSLVAAANGAVRVWATDVSPLALEFTREAALRVAEALAAGFEWILIVDPGRTSRACFLDELARLGVDHHGFQSFDDALTLVEEAHHRRQSSRDETEAAQRSPNIALRGGVVVMLESSVEFHTPATDVIRLRCT